MGFLTIVPILFFIKDLSYNIPHILHWYLNWFAFLFVGNVPPQKKSTGKK
jgi:hypothetical protein